MSASGMVTLVGDVMIAKPFAESGRGQTQGFCATLAVLRESDLVIANLEMPFSRRGARVPKHANLRSDPEIVHDVRVATLISTSTRRDCARRARGTRSSTRCRGR